MLGVAVEAVSSTLQSCMLLLQVPVVQAVNIELIDLGTHPIAIGGVKAYETADEESMLEVPVQWGSNARVCVSVRVGFGGMYMNIPIEVKDVQVVQTVTLLILLTCSQKGSS